jgi:hypothetical protein
MSRAPSLPADTVSAFHDVEVDVAQNWLHWLHYNYSEALIHRTFALSRERDQARDLIAEKCAPWFEVQS